MASVPLLSARGLSKPFGGRLVLEGDDPRRAIAAARLRALQVRRRA